MPTEVSGGRDFLSIRDPPAGAMCDLANHYLLVRVLINQASWFVRRKIRGREQICGPVSIGAGADLLSPFEALDFDSEISGAGLSYH